MMMIFLLFTFNDNMMVINAKIKEEQNRKKLAACAKSFLRKLFDFAPPRSLFSEMFNLLHFLYCII